MKHKRIEFGSNKGVDVYDDIFTFAEMYEYNKFIQNSLFMSNGKDSDQPNQYPNQFYSLFTLDDAKRMNIFNSNGFKILDETYKILTTPIQQIRVNVVTPAERSTVHIDTFSGKTLLYYSSLEWKLEWGGHTLFMDDNLEDAKYTCLYKPGRVVVFDGSIPHMILTPTIFCPANRYTFVIQNRIDS